MKKIIYTILITSWLSNIYSQCWNTLNTYTNTWTEGWETPAPHVEYYLNSNQDVFTNKVELPYYASNTSSKNLQNPNTFDLLVSNPYIKSENGWVVIVKNFGTENKHLPEIPSEAEVLENGIDVSEMNKLLLHKVEELTLYLIGQNKKIEKLESAVSKLSK